MRLNKEEDSNWFMRLKQFLQVEPQNKDQLISLLRDAQIRALINAETLAMIEGVILFSQMKVRDIMLPKQQMTCVNSIKSSRLSPSPGIRAFLSQEKAKMKS